MSMLSIGHPGAIALDAPHRIAVRMGEETLSYRELDRASATLAARLRDHGLTRGDVLAILMTNTPAYFIAAWAAQRSGLYCLAVSTRLKKDEITYILSDSGAKALITDQNCAAQTAQAITLLAAPPICFSFESGTPFATLDLDPPRPNPDEVEGGDMLYTSGTTGHPKGVKRPLSFAPLGSERRRVERQQELFGMDQHTVYLSPAPLYHAAPLRFAMNVLRLGGCIVVLPRFDAKSALKAIARFRVTHSQWVPTMFSRLLALDPALHRETDLSSHMCAIHAGAPCPEDIKRRMIDWWGPILHEYYSGTESIGFTHITSREWLERPGSVGRPWRCTIHILGDDGQECPPNTVGDVYFEGGAPLVYHNAPDKTAAASNRQGWATMGDIGYVDTDGYLFLTGRRSFTIVSGGVNIYPKEVEDALMAHPDVADAAVFGVPDPDLGETVQAVIELIHPVADEADKAVELAAFLRTRIAGYKCPRFIAFTDALPRMDTGKLRKADLVEAYRNEVARGHRV